MSDFRGRYGALPELPEHVVRELLSEVERFSTFVRHDPKGARREVMEEVRWLDENKGFLGRAVEAAVDSALDLFSDKLSHADWVLLELFLLKGFLLVLQGLNEAMGKRG